MPAHQVAEFNRLVVLMNACNVYLASYITTLEQFTEKLELRFAALVVLLRMGRRARGGGGAVAAVVARTGRTGGRQPTDGGVALDW
jgi:hypothetical protein